MSLRKLQMEKMVEQYQAQSSNIKEHLKPVLKIGDPVGSELRKYGCVGPFVRLQEKGETCFLTSDCIFGPPDKNNVMRVVYYPSTQDQKQDICGEVVFIGNALHAALVKISDDFIPKHCTFIDVDSDDLSRAGLKFPYKMRGTCNLRKLDPKTYIDRKIVVHCPNGRLSTGNINLELKTLPDSPITYFKLATDSPDCLPGSPGSAVFIVEDNNSLSCIGILLGDEGIHGENERNCVVILIQYILDKFSHELGQSVVIETFENKKPSIDRGTLSEDSEDSDDILSSPEKMRRSTGERGMTGRLCDHDNGQKQNKRPTQKSATRPRTPSAPLIAITRSSSLPSVATQPPMPPTPPRALTPPPRGHTPTPMAPIPPPAAKGVQWLDKHVRVTNEQEHLKPALKIGDPVGSELGSYGCVGPFVRLQEKGEICFLTSCHIFGRSKINNGMAVFYLPSTADKKQDICGEVIMTLKNLNAVLVKISDDFIPKHCTFIDVDSDDLSRAGLKFPYKMRGTRDLSKLDPETYIDKKIVVHCSNGRLSTGNINLKRETLLNSPEYPMKSFILATDIPECLHGSSGSAVFLVEDNNSLSCIGILIGETDDKYFVVILIQDILDKFSLELGQSLVVEYFENKKPSIDRGTLSEDAEDSDDILSSPDDVIRAKDSHKDSILNNCEVTKLLLNKGRKSQELFKECQKICQVIKDESEHITHVEAAYRFGDDKNVIFLVFAAKNIEIDLIWTTEIRIIDKYSDESSVVLHCKENSPLTEIESQRIGEIIDMHSKKLMSHHKFLSAISASSVSSRYFGPMRLKHLIEKRPCIVLNVLVKGIIPLNEEYFPTELQGTPVDVREGGVRLCVNKADEYQENAILGCKITSSTCPEKSGTLGGFIEHLEYGLCGITCAHVVVNDNEKFKLKEMSTVTVEEDKIMYQPADDGKSKNKLGKLVQLTYKEGENDKPGVDLALFRIEKRAPKEGQFPDSKLPSFNTGLVWGKTGIPSGQRDVRKFGYVTLNTSGVMQCNNCTIREVPFHSYMTVGNGTSLTTTLYKQYLIKSCDENIPFCKLGDSGALVFMEDNTGGEPNLRCIGMLVALAEGNSGYVTPITAILDELKVKQFKPFITHSANSSILELISGMFERLEKLEERMSSIEADNNK